MKSYEEIQQEEAKTWNIEDPVQRREKIQREVIRYPLMKKQMGLDLLDTSWMEVWDIGCSATGGVSQVMNCKQRVCIDPLADEYSKYFDTHFFLNKKGEDLKEDLAIPDLIIVTNALDHFDRPEQFLQDLVTYMKPGAYFAHFHAIDNAITHPHPAHQYNVNPQLIRNVLRNDFEECWYLDFQHDGLRYGWFPYLGSVGQPAFSGLYRKTTGYGERKE